ncbi:MAG TPA: hypothetical protein VMR50_18525 [Myxococcota bacterium]|nr:hypothetical protein [Myxococcota bacterium]
MNFRPRSLRWLASIFLLIFSMQVGAAALHHPLSHGAREPGSSGSEAEHHASSCGLCQLVSQLRSQTGAIGPLPIALPDGAVWHSEARSFAEPSQCVPLAPRSRAPPRSGVA